MVVLCSSSSNRLVLVYSGSLTLYESSDYADKAASRFFCDLIVKTLSNYNYFISKLSKLREWELDYPSRLLWHYRMARNSSKVNLAQVKWFLKCLCCLWEKTFKASKNLIARHHDALKTSMAVVLMIPIVLLLQQKWMLLKTALR